MDRHQLRDESLAREYHAKVDCSACGKALEVWGVSRSGTVGLLCPECVSPDRSGMPPRRVDVQAEFDREFHAVYDWPSEILPVETSPS